MSLCSDDWSKYEAMKAAGSSSHEIYRTGRADGLDSIASIRMLRTLFGFDLMRAKEVALQADGIVESLDAYQESLIPAIEAALQDMEKDDKKMCHAKPPTTAAPEPPPARS